MNRQCFYTLMAIVAFVPLTSCSKGQEFRIVVTVLDAIDGKPIAGAVVILDNHGIEDRKLDTSYGSPHDQVTNDAGYFAYEFYVSPYPSDAPRWYLKVSKTGYETAAIDIKPSPQPPHSRSVIDISQRVELMRKVE
jgi:hypothetical protein